MKVIVFSLLIFFLLMANGATTSPIELLEPKEILDIEHFDQKLERLKAKINQCAAAGLASSVECHCFYPDKLASAKKSYKIIAEKHPDWVDRAILWRDSKRAHPSSLHMGGAKFAIEKSCQSFVSR
jgi:hypothetical protein